MNISVVIHKLLLAGVLAGGTVFLAGCGGGDAEVGSIDATQQAWSASCATASTDRSFTGAIDPETLTPATYNKCTKSYIIDISFYNGAYTGVGSGGGPDARIYARYAAGTRPTNPTDCANITAGIILFRKVNGSWVDVSGQVAANGVWTAQFGCLVPQAYVSGMIAGASYRVAVTARNTLDQTVPVGVLSAKAENIN